MHGMLDTHARVAYARVRAERLRDVMLASEYSRPTDDNAGRREPARAARFVRAALPRIHRGTV